MTIAKQTAKGNLSRSVKLRCREAERRAESVNSTESTEAEGVAER